VLQLVNTSNEEITIQKGTIVAELKAIKEEDFVGEGSASPVDVLRADAYPRQLDPRMKENNANVPAN
jgi:hypothetical protein